MREHSRHSYQYMILLCREKVKHFCVSGRFSARVDVFLREWTVKSVDAGHARW